MRRLIHLVPAMAAILTLTACATLRVSSHVERGHDFTRYRTFDWGSADALPAGDPRLDNDRFFEDHLEGAIEKQMAARGYARAAVGTVPDVRIHYHAVVARHLDVDEADRRSGFCTGDGCLPGIVDYEQGTLIVDVIDASTNRLVWRGWAQGSVEGVLGNRARLARRIDQSVGGLFVRLPAAR